MNAAEWRLEDARWSLESAAGRVTADPLRGLTLHPLHAEALGPLLGLEVACAHELEEPLALAEPGHPPELFARQDVLLAQFKPTPSRQVECHARWRVHGAGLFDLEVSALTPGKWSGLAIHTCSHLPPGNFEIVQTDDALRPIVLCRPTGAEHAWLEMCHPKDGLLFDITTSGGLRFHLFDQDLEKGVILRGRLRGQLLPKQADAAAALAAYGKFLAEKPNLSI